MVPGQESQDTRPGPAAGGDAVPDAVLPPELGFLPANLVPMSRLRRVADRARELDLSPERVLLADGVVPSDRYYRLLAAHLGLPFAERPLAAAPGARLDAVLRDGVLPLAGNAFGWSALAAPSGPLLRRLLAEGPGRAGPSVMALTSPERLEALIRQHCRGEVTRAASRGLPGWRAALSAHGGLSGRQKLWVSVALAVLVVMAVSAPGACLDLLALLFSAGFLLACLVRAAAAAASPPMRGGVPRRVPDRDLPVYSVVVPLYREAREVRRLVEALARLDYPVLGSKHT